MTPRHKQSIAMLKAREHLRQANEQLKQLINEVEVIQDLYNIEKRKFEELKPENNQVKGHQWKP